MSGCACSPNQLDRIEAMLQTLMERTAPRPKPPPGPNRSAEVDAFVAVWNKNCGGLPQAEGAKPGTKRYREILACLDMTPSLSRWAEAIGTLAASRWHRGANESGFIATIDHIIRPAHRQTWLDKSRAYQPSIAVVPRLVPCVKCGSQATVGPGTGQASLSPEALCPMCFGGR